VVATLGDRDLEPCFVLFVADQPGAGGEGGAVVELDTLAPAIEVLVRHQALDLDHVCLGHGLLRVEQAVRERAVVRREQNAARGKVEAADRVHARPDAPEHLADGGATLGVAEGRDHVLGLVQHEVDEVVGHEPLAVDLDLVGARVGLGAQLGDDRTVHAHAPGEDEGFGGAARSEPRPCDQLLEPLFVARHVTPSASRRGPGGGIGSHGL